MEVLKIIALPRNTCRMLQTCPVCIQLGKALPNELALEHLKCVPGLIFTPQPVADSRNKAFLHFVQFGAKHRYIWILLKRQNGVALKIGLNSKTEKRQGS